MPRMDGFEHQRLCVVPRPMVETALAHPVTRRLVVTDAGYFPDARDHVRVRPHGAEEAVLMVCLTGAGWVQVNGEQVTVRPSTYVLIPALAPHSYGASSAHPWTIWWLHFRGAELPDVAAMLGVDQRPGVVPLRSVARIASLFDEIVTNLERGPTPAHLMANTGLAWHLLTQLAVDRALPDRGTPLDRAIRYLQERIDTTVRVSELATLVNLSPSHLSALFRRATGGGVTAYHLAMKMTRARALLDTTAMTVAEVARAVGYDDPLYFSRQFRRVHGDSPTGYRSVQRR